VFNFMKYRLAYLLFSLLFLVPGIISLVLFGVRPGLDFTGGALLELRFTQPPRVALNTGTVNDSLKELYTVDSVQTSGQKQYIFRGQTLEVDQKNQVVTNLIATFGETSELRFETVGPILGQELIRKTLVAVMLAAVLITLYVARQFNELKYGVSAVLAMLHDSLILLGAFSLLGRFFHVEVDVLFVTALLTTLSFSVHDTVVVFDRVREFKRQHAKLSSTEVINGAILQTLGRSLNNSLTIIITLLTLVLLGGESIRWFAVALLIGAITGTYSSTFTAAPLLLIWEQLSARAKLLRARR